MCTFVVSRSFQEDGRGNILNEARFSSPMLVVKGTLQHKTNIQGLQLSALVLWSCRSFQEDGHGNILSKARFSSPMFVVK